VELIQTPINNEQQEDNPMSEEQHRNAEFSPSARLAYLFALLSKHHIINPLNAELNLICHFLALVGGATIVVVSRLRVKVCNGIGDKAPLVFSLHLKAH
jgi:hypothetical protein